MNDHNKKIIALIPARSGSKRIPNKNLYIVNKHPLIAYTIQSALNSGIFDSVMCLTDNQLYADVAKYYGAETPFLRPKEISTDTSPDIDWLKWVLLQLKGRNIEFDLYSILRPTSPFRRASTIQRALHEFIESGANSLRAVQLCGQHPGKMWTINNNRMIPLISESINNTPMHSHQYATLPKTYIQDASLEISKTSIALTKNIIIDEDVYPFISQNLEGFDINTTEDIILLDYYVKNKADILEPISQKPFVF